MPEACGSGRAPPPAPTKPNFGGRGRGGAGLLDAGGLQQRQGATSGADEDELRGHGAAAGRGRIPGAVAQRQAPAAVTQLLEAAHLVAEVELGVVVGREADELLGER